MFANSFSLVELAVVIGKDGRNISAENAEDYIGGKHLKLQILRSLLMSANLF